jgi:hypothetical protein
MNKVRIKLIMKKRYKVEFKANKNVHSDKIQISYIHAKSSQEFINMTCQVFRNCEIISCEEV